MKPTLNLIAGTAWAVLAGLIVLAFTNTAVAEGESETERLERLERVEEKVDALTDEVGRLESIFAVPEELEFESFSGLGPAASKVYKRESGLSIGGYGETRLRTFHDQGGDNENDVFDSLRAVLYVGYKFNDKWVFNSELEFEHAGSGGGGTVSTEFATIDYLHSDEFNVRAGVVLIPMGFVNEIHEPNFFYGAERPEVERRIMPSTWRENGAGIFGTIADRFHYRMYVVNGLNGAEFDRDGLRGGRQKASEALSDDFAFVGRVDVDVADGLLVGGSVYVGQSGQEQTVDPDEDPNTDGFLLPDMMTTIYEVHAQYKAYGFSFRGLYSQAFIDETGEFNRVYSDSQDDDDLPNLASQMQGWYVEGGYNVLQFVDTKQTLEPFFRFEQVNTQQELSSGLSKDRTQDVDIYVAGLHYRPIPQVVFKLDYRNFDQRSGKRADEVQALVGYVF